MRRRAIALSMGVCGLASLAAAAPVSVAAAAVPLFGVSISSPATLAQDTSQFGHLGVVHVYYPGLPDPAAWSSGLPGAASGSAILVSFKDAPATVLAGADDGALRNFFSSAPTGHPIYYTYYFEPEDNIAAGAFTKADYAAAWTHVAALARTANNSYLHATLMLMGYDLEAASHRNWLDYLPGGGIITTVSWEGSGSTPPTAPANFMGPAIVASKGAGLAYGFDNFGLADVAARPAWLTDVGNYLLSSGAAFACMRDPVSDPTTYVNDPPSIAVWRGFVSGSGTTQANAPPPKPTTLPPAPTPLATTLPAVAAIKAPEAATPSGSTALAANLVVRDASVLLTPVAVAGDSGGLMGLLLPTTDPVPWAGVLSLASLLIARWLYRRRDRLTHVLTP